MNTIPDLFAAEWVKSSYSNTGGGDCVEWAPTVSAISGVVPVRDSKAPIGPALVFPAETWSSFISAVKRDELRS